MDWLIMPRRIAALLLVAAVWPLEAEAQDRAGITIQAGVISGDDAAPLDSFRRPVFTASVQRVFKQHFVIEGEISHWTLERVIEHGPHPITGPQGVLGFVQGTTITDSHRFWNFGANVLLKSSGPVRVFGGGGAGLSTDRNVYQQQSFGCSTSLDQRTCDPFENITGRGPIAMLRMLGGVEIPLTSRVGVVGSARFEKTAWEDRRGWLSATAGIRFAFD
jgi:hypothetical protein